MTERERAREEVGLLARAELRDGAHLARDPGQLFGPRRGAHAFMLLLGIVHEVAMIGAAQDEHLLGGEGPLEQLVHAGEREGDIVFRDQVEDRNVAAPTKVELQRKDARLRLGGAARRERYHGADGRFDLGHREGGPASEAVSHDSDSGGIDEDAQAG